MREGKCPNLLGSLTVRPGQKRSARPGSVLPAGYGEQRAARVRSLLGWAALPQAALTQLRLQRSQISVKRSGKSKHSAAAVYWGPGIPGAAAFVQRAGAVASGRCPFEANHSWQRFSFHPMVKTATLKRTSLCKTSDHKIFVSSFPESSPKSDSEVINLCWIKECNLLWIQRLLSKEFYFWIITNLLGTPRCRWLLVIV